MRTLFGQGEVTKRKRKARGKVKEFCLGRRGKKGNGFGSHADPANLLLFFVEFSSTSLCSNYQMRRVSSKNDHDSESDILSFSNRGKKKKKKKLETRVEISSLENRLEYLSPIFVSKFLCEKQISKRGRRARRHETAMIERKENPVDRYFCHSVLPLCSVDRFCFPLFAF